MNDEVDDPMWSDRCVQRDVSLPKGFELLLKPDAEHSEGRWYFQIKAWRADTFTGEMGWGYGGKAYLSPHACESELVQTAWGLFQGYVIHEAREGFQWRGRRVFGPHISTQALWEVAERTDYRKEA